jgi:hypothetical protein
VVRFLGSMNFSLPDHGTVITTVINVVTGTNVLIISGWIKLIWAKIPQMV